MPKLPGSPEKPHYNSVKAYLSELAKDIAEMVVDPVKMERFRKQLKIYADFWKQWSTFDEANRQACWVPSMGRPECIFNIFSRSYNPLKDIAKKAKRLAGSYALCALIHDNQSPHLDKINTDIIPTEAIEETLSAPRNTLGDRIIGNWNSGPDVREIYLIEDFFNMANVDLQEFCKSEENKLTQASIEGQIQQASQLSDEEFLELTAKKFEQRAKKVLSTDENWHDLDRSLKGWFDTVIDRLKKSGFSKSDIGLLKCLYKNLLFNARGINIKSFRGSPDSLIASSARKEASELAAKFKNLAQRVKDNLASERSKEKEKQKVKPEGEIHSIDNNGDNSMEWDVFICHASEDKENFVEPLAKALKEAVIKVWYDRFELKLGDSLRGKIDEGLANSQYGVVVLSKSFFNKKWPKEELDALVSRQNDEGKKVILPIWHGIGAEEVRKFSPILASKLAAQSSDSLESIVVQIRDVLNENSTPKKPDKEEKQKTGPKDKGDLTETEQVSLQEIIEVLKKFWEGKDFEAAKSALPPIAKTYDILCRSGGQYGAKTTDIIRRLGSAANNGSGYYPALLENFASPEVIEDLEKWQELSSETDGKQRKESINSQKGNIIGDVWSLFGIPINIKKLYIKLKHHPILFSCCLLLIVIIITYSLWISFIIKSNSDSIRNSNKHKVTKTTGDFSPAIITSGPNSPITMNYELKGEKNGIDNKIPPKLYIKRLIQDFEIELQQYYNNFLRKYQKVEDDFISSKSSVTPLDSTIFSDARLDIDELTSGLERNIQNILLKEFSAKKLDGIETLSKEYTKYQLAINKAISLKTKIAEMEDDPSRITRLLDRINRRK